MFQWLNVLFTLRKNQDTFYGNPTTSQVLFDYLCGMLTRKKNVTSDDETVPTNDKNVKDACVNHICNIAGAAAAKNSCQFWQVSKGSWL